MRNWMTVLLVSSGVLIGYALAGHRVEAQTDLMPFTPGEAVSLHMEDGRRQVRCMVGMQRGDFLSCKADANRPVTWYNLRFVAEVRHLAE